MPYRDFMFDAMWGVTPGGTAPSPTSSGAPAPSPARAPSGGSAPAPTMSPDQIVAQHMASQPQQGSYEYASAHQPTPEPTRAPHQPTGGPTPGPTHTPGPKQVSGLGARQELAGPTQEFYDRQIKHYYDSPGNIGSSPSVRSSGAAMSTPVAGEIARTLAGDREGRQGLPDTGGWEDLYGGAREREDYDHYKGVQPPGGGLKPIPGTPWGGKDLFTPPGQRAAADREAVAKPAQKPTADLISIREHKGPVDGSQHRDAGVRVGGKEAMGYTSSITVKGDADLQQAIGAIGLDAKALSETELYDKDITKEEADKLLRKQ